MVNCMLSYSRLSQGFWGEAMAVFRLPDPKLKTLGKRGIECIFVGYAKHSKAFRFYVIEPNESVSINSIIESRDAIFDENRFKSIPRPIQRTPKNFGHEFQLYLIEGTKDMVSDQHSYCFSVEDDPKTFDEAMNSYDVDGIVEKFKVRLVIQGFRQKSGIDYFDTYALMARISTIRLLIALALIHNLIIHQIDVKTTFLNGELNEEVYMNQPKGFIMPGNENKVDLTKEFLSSRFSLKDMGEADFILALEATGKEVEWLRNLILKIPLWSKPIAPISIYYNIITLAKAYSQMYNRNSRHLGVKHSMIHELIMNVVVFIEFLRSQKNLVDHLTKGLAGDLVLKSVKGMGLNGLKHMYLLTIPMMCLEPAEKEDEVFTSEWLISLKRAYSSQPKKGNEGFVKNFFAFVLKYDKQNPIMSAEPNPAIVLLNSNSISSKEKISNHVGVASWLHELLPANNSFDNSSSGEEYEDDEVEHISEKKGVIACLLKKRRLIMSLKQILKRKNDKEESKGEDPIFPLGLTPDTVEEHVVENNGDSIHQPNVNLHSSNEGISSDKNGSSRVMKIKLGGLILEVMEDLIKVGQTIRYNMESPSVGFSEGILCVWDPSLFIKDNVTISDSFLPIRGDFNEVRCEQEIFGTTFNVLGANAFNHFITMAGLVDLTLEVFPSLFAICLDRHLSDHRPILMRELDVDYGLILFRIYHSWFSKAGFDKLVEESWKILIFLESNSIILLKKKFQALKTSSKIWCKEDKQRLDVSKSSIQSRLSNLDKMIDQGKGNEGLVNERSTLLKELQDLNASASLDMAQKAKIRWSIERDENSKYFHGIIDKKR
ncbi:zinc finger, CCHC-type containing protein [Tanacetum coccineum]|uniref:Zinc finger, CCHC-type containing protein n=1 Tax=Tanacetum coccineum TaxID=301880 RepID=A0ABQ5F4K5_9ASTR